MCLACPKDCWYTVIAKIQKVHLLVPCDTNSFWMTLAARWAGLWRGKGTNGLWLIAASGLPSASNEMFSQDLQPQEVTASGSPVAGQKMGGYRWIPRKTINVESRDM